jgi:hypothetical protein
VISGLDYSYDWRNVRIPELKPAGYQFVMRYLTFPDDGRDAKRLTSVELAALRAAGVVVGLNWEYKLGDQRRGADGGYIDAIEAVRQAKELGYPVGSAIYFSTDFDPVLSDWPLIDAYFANCRWILGDAGYRVGQYGGVNAIRRSLDLSLIDVAWQTYAWSGGLWDGRAAIRQVKNNVTVAGGNVDINEMHNDAHLWCYC